MVNIHLCSYAIIICTKNERKKILFSKVQGVVSIVYVLYPSTYPLLFPNGDIEWHVNLMYINIIFIQNINIKTKQNEISMYDAFCDE